MISEEELDDDFEDEVKEECETNYGPVNEVLVYLEKQSEEEDAETIVKVFVEFSLAETAKGGAWGRIVLALFFQEEPPTTPRL